MIDLVPYIGIISLIVASVCGIVVLKRNGILLKKFKHNKTEVEFDHSEQTVLSSPANDLEGVNVLPLRVQLSSDAEQDCQTLGLAYEEPIHFVRKRSRASSVTFRKRFRLGVISFPRKYSPVILARLCCNNRTDLNRCEAYPPNDNWSECLAVYRQASLLPIRQKGQRVFRLRTRKAA